ncbi:4668_t:CDS:2, partial [Diversispora eburnea]
VGEMNSSLFQHIPQLLRGIATIGYNSFVVVDKVVQAFDFDFHVFVHDNPQVSGDHLASSAVDDFFQRNNHYPVLVVGSNDYFVFVVAGNDVFDDFDD